VNKKQVIQQRCGLLLSIMLLLGSTSTAFSMQTVAWSAVQFAGEVILSEHKAITILMAASDRKEKLQNIAQKREHSS